MFELKPILGVLVSISIYYLGILSILINSHFLISHAGPAKCLFSVDYYQSMKKSLKPDGILCCQGECLWLDLDLIKNLIGFCRDLFPVASYAYTTIPTYPSGQIGFILCSNSEVSHSFVCVCASRLSKLFFEWKFLLSLIVLLSLFSACYFVVNQ